MKVYRWQRDRVDLPGVAIARLAGVRGLVVDAGCGLGTYTRRLRRDRPDLSVLPIDLSAAMAGAVVSDVCRLPLKNAAAGAVLAMHMLYHVAHPEDAVLELRRVLRPGASPS
jgi:ubiquinone/menaquinone biosynthesis C-methylase UbiE